MAEPARGVLVAQSGRLTDQQVLDADRPGLDGAQHTEDPRQRWDDMERDIGLGLDGYLTLRFPAWLVAADPEHVARRILEALRRKAGEADKPRMTPLDRARYDNLAPGTGR